MFEQERENKTPILFALSTCPRCNRFKDFLKEHDVQALIIDIDLLEKPEKKEKLKFLSQYNPVISMPTLLIGDEVIIGENYDKAREILKIES